MHQPGKSSVRLQEFAVAPLLDERGHGAGGGHGVRQRHGVRAVGPDADDLRLAIAPQHLVEEPPTAWIARNLKAGDRLGFDPWLVTADEVPDPHALSHGRAQRLRCMPAVRGRDR